MTSIVTTSASEPYQDIRFCYRCRTMRDVTIWDMGAYKQIRCNECGREWNALTDPNSPKDEWAREVRTSE